MYHRKNQGEDVTLWIYHNENRKAIVCSVVLSIVPRVICLLGCDMGYLELAEVDRIKFKIGTTKGFPNSQIL